MSTKIRIKNFQSIKDSEFVVDGFTVIIGRNNIGKSAVIRAVDAALTNRSGNEFIRHGEKASEVFIDKNDLSIEWKKGETASYKINSKPFSKLGRNVPEPITDAGFRKLEVGDLKLNPLIAHQFDELFLLDKPGSVITEVLSSLYKLDVLIRADDLCQKELRSGKSLLKTRESDFVGLTEDLKKYEGFEDIKTSLLGIKKLDAACLLLKQQLAEIDIFTNNLKVLARSVKNLQGIKDIQIPDIKEAEQDLNEIIWVIEKMGTLKRLDESINKIKDAHGIEIPSYAKLLKDLESLKTVEEESQKLKTLVQAVRNKKEALSGIESMMSDTISLLSKTEKFVEDTSFLINKGTEFITLAGSARKTRDDLQNANNELEILNKEFGQMGVCALCGRPKNCPHCNKTI